MLFFNLYSVFFPATSRCGSASEARSIPRFSKLRPSRFDLCLMKMSKYSLSYWLNLILVSSLRAKMTEVKYLLTGRLLLNLGSNTFFHITQSFHLKDIQILPKIQFRKDEMIDSCSITCTSELYSIVGFLLGFLLVWFSLCGSCVYKKYSQIDWL